jgi:glutamyl-tRNA reductase
VDDLQAIANDYLRQRQDEIARCEQIIRQRAESLLGGGRQPESGNGIRPAFEPE